jgi:ArsR family transcriptional regulator
MPRTRTTIPTDVLETAAGVMRAIAHPLRLRVLEILDRGGEVNVSALCEEAGASQPAISQQLARMRLAGVLAARRDGNAVYYRVLRPEVLGVLECVRKMGRRQGGDS